MDIDRLLELDDRRRALIQESEAVRARRNEVAASIKGAASTQRPVLIEEGRSLKTRLGELEGELNQVAMEFDAMMLMVPNVALKEVPIGQGEEDNLEVRRVGEPRSFDFEPRDHEELGELLGILDKPRGIKVAGARSYLLRGAGALLEQAVISLALEILVERGYELITGPVMVNQEALVGTGFFPYGQEDTYHLERDDKYLIGTSEVVLVSLNADEILEKSDFPRQIHGALALLSPRGGQRRSRHARRLPRPSVHQGRAGRAL